MSCIFCKIVAGEIPADIVHSDDECIAFRDLHPQAPVHILVIPRRHIETVDAMEERDVPVVGRMAAVARDIAREEEIHEAGYRLVLNCNEGAGQTVFHMHMHLLGGRDFGWPPG
jgi:histidine triad (HIT) family protein